MSVMIRGMTMPDMCSECDFLCGLICPDGIYVCDCPAETIHGSNVTRAVEEDARHPDCPLVEVSEPHGRLIDGDAMKKQIPQKPVMGYKFPEKIREVIKRTDPERAESKTECCPVCGRTLGVSQFVKTKTGLHFGDPYCKRCGQAIDWEGE